ncbi:MAG: hypothetical protein MUE34_04410 [Acidimicrobiales bacterium]|nr:hypothetical protein [Acidimicrobiales bacterium]
MRRMLDLDAALKSLRAQHAEIEQSAAEAAEKAARYAAEEQRLRQDAARLLAVIEAAESEFSQFVEPAAPRLPSAVLTVVPEPRARVEATAGRAARPFPPPVRSRVQQQILEVMASEPTREWTPVDLSKVTGLERSTVRSNMLKLDRGQLIRRVGYGRYCVEVPEAV